MQTTITFVLSMLMGLVVAGPAATPTGPCPMEKCYNQTNACGVSYGGCWDECGPVPTFTEPLCLSPATATASISGSIFSNATQSLMAPSPSTTGETMKCPLVMCVDKITMCGSHTVAYGGCYDTCGTKTPIAPVCTEAPMSITATPTMSTTKPKKTRAPCTASKAWMCAPAGW